MATIKAGCDGNFSDGLCCRMVIEVKRVFDGCATSDSNITLALTTAEAIPPGAEFVSARVIESTLENFSVTNADNGFSRVVGDVVTKFAVTYSSGGQLFSISAEQTESRDIMLRLPNENSAVMYSIEVQTDMRIGSGAIIGNNAVSITGCRVQIIKVTAPVDILVPTYGYCKYPPCTGFTCPGIGDIFPTMDGEG